MKHIKSIAYNRSTNSTGDTEACLYIEDQLKSARIKTKYQYFIFDSPIRILIRITYMIILTYLILYRLVLVIAFYFAVKYLFATTRNFSLVRKEDSKNLIGTIPPSKKHNKPPVVIISAHYDSFSANIPFRLQNIFFFLFRIIIIPYFVITVYFASVILRTPTVYQPTYSNIDNLVIISSIIEFVVVLLIFLLIYNTKKSQGAIDNASGVSILIELSKLLKKYPLDNYEVIILFTGAEEWGLLGSKRYCKRNRKILEEKYDLDRSFNINVDMVGSYIGMIQRRKIFGKKNQPSALNTAIDEVAEELDVKVVTHHHLINPKTDHRSFKKLARKTKSNFKVVCFHSDKDSKYIHSRRDTPDKCSSEVLNNAVNLIYYSLKQVESSTLN